jgi:hypothetical protein
VVGRMHLCWGLEDWMALAFTQGFANSIGLSSIS